MTILNPPNDTFTMKVMSGVTFQLCQFVSELVITQADFAATFVFEGLGIVLDTSKCRDYLGYLAFVQTVGTSGLLFHHSVKENVDNRSTDNG